MNQSDFLNLFAEVLEVELGHYTSANKLEDIAEWDSLATISLIAMVDEQCNLTLSASDIKKAVTVDDLYKNISERLATC